MEAKRERRIRDKLRMKAKCKRVRPHDVNAVNADHMAECSCWMCGNPRRYFGLKTLQELRAETPTP